MQKQKTLTPGVGIAEASIGKDRKTLCCVELCSATSTACSNRACAGVIFFISHRDPTTTAVTGRTPHHCHHQQHPITISTIMTITSSSLQRTPHYHHFVSRGIHLFVFVQWIKKQLRMLSFRYYTKNPTMWGRGITTPSKVRPL